MFTHIIGNDLAKRYLQTTLDKSKIANSWLFAGPAGIGKNLFAEAFARQLLGRGTTYPPDLHIYRPEGKIGLHSIAAMRQFSEEVYMAPFESKWKVFIIQEAERMLPYSANALLKTFEEPAPDTVIILLSSTPEALLPTVLSRCRTLRFQALSEEKIASFLVQQGKSPEEAASLSGLAQGSIGQALRLAQIGDSPLRKQVLALLSKGTFLQYKELSQAASELAEQVEAGKKEIEVDIRATLMPEGRYEISAAQKQSLEKEVEGAIAMYAMREAYALLEIILAWYRDLHLLHVNGQKAYLIHRDYAVQSHQALQRGQLRPLEAVQQAIAETRLSLERSTSLNICLENLFLKLDFIS